MAMENLGTGGGVKVANVDELHETAKSILNENINGADEASFASILRELDRTIAELKVKWKGGDAGQNIHDLIMVRNGLYGYKKTMGAFSVAAGGIAGKFRSIQNANMANKPELAMLHDDDNDKTLDDYEDKSNEALADPTLPQVADRIRKAADLVDTLISKLQTKNNRVAQNWTKGGKRDEYIQESDDFIRSFKEKYKPMLDKVATNAVTAAHNWEQM